MQTLIGGNRVVFSFDWLPRFDETEVILGLYVSLKSTNAPALRQAFVFIPFPRLGVEGGNEKFAMGPSKQRRFSIRVENVRVTFMEGIKLIKACFSKTLPKLDGQGYGQIGDDSGAVFSLVSPLNLLRNCVA